jgi:hypothetical protein
MTPAQIAAQLHAAIDEGLRLFSGVDETRTAVRPAADAWCAREVVGHLIDSACNNHRRFVLGQAPDVRKFDGYDGDEWVARQRYHQEPWRDLVALWTAYNRHLAHVIASTPAETLQHSGASPDGERTVTVGFLMEDYVTHMRHHFDQIRRTVAAPPAAAAAAE